MQAISKEEKYQELVTKLKSWNNAYYLKDAPEVEDAVYDAHMQELIALEKAHPELITAGSPTQYAGASTHTTKFTKLEHLIPMISLANAYNAEEIRDWEDRINRIIGAETYREYVFEPKIDGLSIAIDYKQGKLIRAATRGDGKFGEDVTENVKTIRTLPKQINYPGPISIRGEVFIDKKQFQKINQEQETKGEALYANPRNTAAGSLRQLDAAITSERNLDAFFYGLWGQNALKASSGKVLSGEVMPDRELEFETHYACLEKLSELGLKTNSENNILCKSIDEVVALYDLWQNKKNTLDYEIDGAVVKINQIALQKTLGSTAKSPRWAIALKFTAEVAETQIESVSYEVGRLGTITPVANLVPVLLSGSTVKRATLHNFDQIERLQVKVGDFVQLRKAGEIIPEIIEVNFTKRPATASEIQVPFACPVCGSTIEREDISYRCTNIVGCPAQIQRRLEHWCSKAAMDINGVGPALVEALLERGLIKTPLDLYRLKLEDIKSLDRQGDKSAQNAIASIQASTKPVFSKLLYALGIKHIGVNIAELIASYYPSLDALEAAQAEDLLKIDGLGPRIVESLQEFLKSEAYAIFKKQLVGLLEIQTSESKKLSDKFAGLSFVITGSLSQPRSYYEDIIKTNGGKVSSSVSKKTSYLLCGADPGSKLDKATEFGVKILNEEDFKLLC